MTLQELGIKYNSDKATWHDFCDFYDKHLDKYRNDSLNFLEIGIGEAASLLMWNDYFEQSKIYGIDIDPNKIINKGRIISSICDQSDRSYLAKVFDGVVFDFIVDDGGHYMDQQQISLATMFKRLKNGNFYILEDLHTSYFCDYNPKPTFLTTLDILEKFQKTKIFFSNYLSVEENDYLTDSIEDIEIYKATGRPDKCDSVTSIIKKKK